MFYWAVKEMYNSCKVVGIAKNSREFSRIILGERDDYYQCYLRDGADAIPRWVASHAISTLRAYSDRVDGAVATDMEAMIADAEASARAARQYYRR